MLRNAGEAMPKIILASTSPRRIEILKNLHIPFISVPSGYKENADIKEPEKLVIKLSEGKAKSVLQNYINDDAVIIAADTIVSFNGNILGKPKDKEDAFSILKSLSGRSHDVLTGVCIYRTYNGSIKCVQDFEKTEVFFSDITDNEIKQYIATGEPMDKAGAYGIQGYGSFFVEKIIGSYYNVVGLPIEKVYNILKGMGVNLLEKEV